ncbi:MAG: hypothetical protein QF903_08900 [Planctomycetota bacterium]|jgi:DNA-binding transcriptional regulator GbsR (MarR family)|nr:hypothetical protein [Planctomycetota bacterium]MDP6764129.1 hypothetical protein [Planctomycetota bacterium]MDP6989582.1 hypothetical protein [Planctomycetota bacterium]
MTSHDHPDPSPDAVELDAPLAAQLPTFELFFKTFGFKRIHGSVWGLLVLSEKPLSNKQVAATLGISQGSTSTCLNELSDWGAIHSHFDPARRCNLHAPVGNTLSIVATVFRRREQVVMGKLRQATEQTLTYVRERYGDRDPRVLTLRSILSSCEIAEAIMQLVFTSVERALGDSSSLLSRALGAAVKVGMAVPARALARGRQTDAVLVGADDEEADAAS